MRRAQRDRAEHAAAEREIGRRAVAARRLYDEDGARELHVLRAALGVAGLRRAGLEGDRARVHVRGRAFHPAALVDREPHSGDVDVADLRAGYLSAADAHVARLDVRHAVAGRRGDVRRGDAFELRVLRGDRAGGDARR